MNKPAEVKKVFESIQRWRVYKGREFCFAFGGNSGDAGGYTATVVDVQIENGLPLLKISVREIFGKKVLGLTYNLAGARWQIVCERPSPIVGKKPSLENFDLSHFDLLVDVPFTV